MSVQRFGEFKATEQLDQQAFWLIDDCGVVTHRRATVYRRGRRVMGSIWARSDPYARSPHLRRLGRLGRRRLPAPALSAPS